MYCTNCGHPIDGNASFCGNCGARIGVPQQIPVQQIPVAPPIINIIHSNGPRYAYKSKWVAFWLCLFLGIFGAHRFYAGKIFTGIVWLCTVGFFGIGWIIDLLTILCGNFRDSHRQYLL